LEVKDKQRAKDFMNPTSIVEAESAAGAFDFKWYFVEEISVF